MKTDTNALSHQHIVLIGAGNVATHIGLTLKEKGANIVQVFSRTMESANALASRLNCLATSQMDDIQTTADVYVISVKDDALAHIVQTVCPKSPDALFIHTAGSMPLNVFEGMARHYGILYPMQTFSKDKLLDFSQVPCFVEASDVESLQRVRSLAETLSPIVHVLSSEDRRYLHLAAVFACNFANHCYAVAEELLKVHGIPVSVLWPLIAETATKATRMPALEAQTGPAVRHDTQIVRAQAQLLSDHAEWQRIYEHMSDDIYYMSKKKKEA